MCNHIRTKMKLTFEWSKRTGIRLIYKKCCADCGCVIKEAK